MIEPATPPLTVALADEAATGRLMADLALLLGAGDVVTLSGDLGAGKTAAARALIRHLAGDATLDVPSPTFTLAQSYDLAAFPLLHVDLYRINSSSELEELGLAPFPDGTVVLLEWPERAADALPADRIDITFSPHPDIGPDARRAVVTGYGAARAKVARLTALRHFLTNSGYLDAARSFMAGDASTRSYARLRRDGVSTILMNSPPRLDQQLIYGGKSYLAAVHLAEEITPFVAVADGLRSCGLSAPAIHHVDLPSGFLISEDFGSLGVVEGDPPTPIAERYQAAIDVLVQLHSEPRRDRLPVTGHDDYALPTFDVEAMLIEVSLLPDWYLPDRDAALTPALRQQFLELWRALLTPVLDAPETWVIRDFHSPNLIWLPEREGLARVGIIDFQDAVRGPAAYDVVSLAQDARVDVSESLEIALLSRYVRGRRSAEPDFDAAGFAARYAVMSAQRNTRLLGVFARLNRRDHKPHYLRHQPRIWGYLGRALAHPALTSLRDWYAANLPPPATD
jgi:tRNA threonylcarbamoyl adenosine modification protein YjeE